MKETSCWIPVDAVGLSEEQASELAEMGMMLEKRPKGKAEWEHYTPEFVGTKSQTLDLYSTFSEILLAQKQFQETRISQPEGEVRFETQLPVSIFFIGDVHLGSNYTDHGRFMEETNEIAETPNAYIVWMANLIDNAIPAQYPANMLVNAIPPDQQVIAMRKIIQKLDEKGKCLGAVTSPCHEGWTYRHTGQDVNALIFGYEGRKFPVLENGGRLNLVFNKTKYLMIPYHMIGPFRSNFNVTHGLKQMNRLKLNMEGDILIGAHYHVGGVEMVYEGQGDYRKQNAYIQTGTYKGTGDIHDQWSIERYGSTGQPSCQSVILWPNERRIEAFLDFRTGMLAHEAQFLQEVIKNG